MDVVKSGSKTVTRLSLIGSVENGPLQRSGNMSHLVLQLLYTLWDLPRFSALFLCSLKKTPSSQLLSPSEFVQGSHRSCIAFHTPTPCSSSPASSQYSLLHLSLKSEGTCAVHSPGSHVNGETLSSRPCPSLRRLLSECQTRLHPWASSSRSSNCMICCFLVTA